MVSNKMKYLILLLTIVFYSCSKKQSIQPSTDSNTSTLNTLKKVEIFIKFGAPNNFASVKWNYQPNIDSAYKSNTLDLHITNYTNSDSILIYTNSYKTSTASNDVIVSVNGVVKEKYSGVQITKKVYVKI